MQIEEIDEIEGIPLAEDRLSRRRDRDVDREARRIPIGRRETAAEPGTGENAPSSFRCCSSRDVVVVEVVVLVVKR